MEKWREFYTDEQIKKVQALELKNLEMLDSVCKKLNINYFAYGGTLIGAVRHKGFIPWDDDLDIAMIRDDYIKFVTYAHEHLSSEYYLQTPYNDKRTPYSFSKLRLKGTQYIEHLHHKLKIEKGIYIDIYPIDNLPDSDETFFKQYRSFHRMAVLYAWRQCPYIEQQGQSPKVIVKKVLKRVVSTVLKLIPQKALVEKMDKIATKYNCEDTNRKGNLYYPKPVNVFDKLYPFIEGDFDGHKINLPSCWHKHLISRYGNYMEFPPEDKRIGHRPYLLSFGDY